MAKDVKVGDIIGIYKILGDSQTQSRDGHKQIHVKCTVCGVERDIRPTNLGATVCNHKQSIIPRYCKCCGKVIPFDENTKVANYNLRNFCNNSCAAKVNNQRKHSEESKLKAATTALARHHGDNLELREAKLKAKSLRTAKTRSVKNAGKYYVEGLIERRDYILCPYCGLRFSQIQNGHLKLHNKTFKDLYNEFGTDYRVVSDVTYAKKVKADKEAQQKLIDAGIHKGWRSRNKTSYAEQYWTSVLDNYKIDYEREFPIWHGSANYFLDFKLERNGKLVDLEIDGKQHKYEDRAALDVKRDAFMQSNGYIVYRIPWNSVNSPEGRQLMQNKINNFLDFYNSL